MTKRYLIWISYFGVKADERENHKRLILGTVKKRSHKYKNIFTRFLYMGEVAEQNRRKLYILFIRMHHDLPAQIQENMLISWAKFNCIYEGQCII